MSKIFTMICLMLALTGWLALMPFIPFGVPVMMINTVSVIFALALLAYLFKIAFGNRGNWG